MEAEEVDVNVRDKWDSTPLYVYLKEGRNFGGNLISLSRVFFGPKL